MRPRRTGSLCLTTSFLLVVIVVLTAGIAFAGRLHPDVDAQLAALPPGGQLSVIVELNDQTDPHVAAAPHRDRRARLRAVVDALRDKAGRTQGPIRALLARERVAGRALRHRPLWIINGVAVTAEPGLIRALAARPDVREVRLDRVIPRPTPTPTSAQPTGLVSEWNIDQIRAPEVWAIDPSYTGVGTVVGSFDTGVDGTHPDLAPRYRGNDAISWFDPYGEHASPFDGNGHGTHTTGTMVGGDAGGTNIGVAPGAQWIAAKGWNDAGIALVSAFHEIFEWFLAPGGDPANAPDVVNMSWAFDEFGCLLDFQADIQALRAAGIFPSVAAGNSGPFPGSVVSPGAYPESVTVGATDIFDEVPYFSGRGPGPCGGEVKPNLSAPGDSINSTVPGGFYLSFSGTSMAAPHVAGAVAVLRAINPALTVDELETLLLQGAVDLGAPGPDFDYGTGRLDLFQSAQIALGGGGPGQPHVTIVATTATATEAGLTAGLFTVSRTGSTDEDLTVHYTISGSATAGSDYTALPGTVTIAAGSETATIPVTPIDDPTAELDETVVVSLTFNSSYFVGNPGKATVTIVSDELLSDLTVSALTVPTGAAAGDTLTISDTTANSGGGPADPSVTRFYLSTDSVADGGDTVLGNRSVPALVPGASNLGTTNVTIPAGTLPGTYFVLAVADGAQTVIESNEENNLLARTVQVGPDLVVSAFTAPAAAGAGVAFSVNDTTRNSGAGGSAASTTRFYLSTNAIWEATDVALGGRAVPALAAGAAHSATTTLTIPAGTTGGIYYLIARADADGGVAEASETNNLASALVRVGPDLTVSALTVPAGGGAGGSISVTDTTTNQGGGTAPASTTRFYLSADYSWSANDTSLGTRAVPALAAGAASTATTSLTIPAGTPSGFWYVLARADSEQGVPEADEANNVTARPITLGADLVVYFAQPVPAAAAPGDTITVSDMVTNLGGGAAGASTTRFYLSADGVLDPGDPVLGARAVPALGAGASSTGSTALPLPGGLVAGQYVLFAKADADEVVGETSETNNRNFGFIQIGADLVVSPLTVPAAGGAGAAVTITDTTRNQAGAGAAASTTRFYLSANSVWDAGDVALGSRAVPSLAAGAGSNASTVVTIPAGTATGGYWIIARADADSAVSETQEGNNAAAAAILVGPDLLLSALTAPAGAGPGASITVNDTTRNQGGGTAGASTTRFYLSADVFLDAGDTMLGARAVVALGPGASHPGATVVTIPAGTATGAWFLLARADADGAVGETTETNNVTSTTIQVGGDLVVSALTVPATAGAGATITVSDTTTNQGAGPVAASVTGFYLSADGVLDAADIALGGRAVPALGAAAAHAASTALVIPASVTGGTWYLIARADANGTVGETFETNNATVRSILVGADLVVSPFSAPPSSGAGAVLTVTDTTRNQGGAAAGASVTGFWLSTNAVWDAADVFLGSRAVPALAIGGTHAASTQLTLPADLGAGSYYVLARADADGAVAETIETNNTAFAAVQVGPDLVLSAFSAPPAAGAGVVVTVSDTTRNQGGGAAPGSTTGFWLSTNPTWDAADVFLGSRAVPALAAGATHAAQTVVTIPAGTAPGLYYLLGRADGDGTVGETQEGNNGGFVAVNVGPDLRISWVGGPWTAPLGQTITVSDSTQNAGGGAVGASTTSFYLSTNTGWDASDIFLGSRAVPALAGGATSTGSIVVTIPAGTPPGGYYLLARADAEGAVAEGQEGNNVNYTTLTIGPDLFVFLSGVPGSAAAGATITVGDTTRNSTGGGTAGGSTTRFYLSANAAWDAGDVAIGSRAVPALAPGGSSLGSTAVTIPAGTAPGTWYVIARADADGDVPEAFEVNNTHYIAIQVTP